jgi:DNA polymerase III subunit alpha
MRSRSPTSIPLQYNLLFERFLNPERVSMPDFDIDFCQGNRDRVIDYVKDKYGTRRGQPNRDLWHHGRACGDSRRGPRAGHELHLLRWHQQAHSQQAGHVGHAAIPAHHAKEGDKNNYAIAMEPILAERIEREREDVKTLIELAQKLEGMTRNVGMHAGGVLIAPGKLTDFCPLYAAAGQRLGGEPV